EPDERLRCAEQYARAARSKRLRETDELQRVAETLLGCEEQRATGRRRAVPARSGPRSLVARQFGNPVAPFVFAPAFFEFLVREQREPEVPVRLRETGRERDCAAECGDRFGETVFRLQRKSEVAPGDRMSGPQREGALVCGNRFVVLAGGRERKTEVVVEFGLIRNCGCGRTQQRKRVGETLALVQHDAEVVCRRRMGRRERKCGAVAALRSFEVAALVHGD